ncbi:MAG: 3-deoxy-8-phosphooctulonate synthase [Planctomycetota bacterium]
MDIHFTENSFGPQESLLLIAGPCVIQDHDSASQIAEVLCELKDRFNFRVVFKASFDKANRTSIQSPRGPGMEDGLNAIQRIKKEFGLPATTDIHLPSQAGPVAEVCDVIQIPAFLSRQTDLLIAAAETGKAVNVKKGQFMAPGDMKHVVGKLIDSGCKQSFVCERGTFFGYGRLVNDMCGLVTLSEIAPVIFDATHSVQQPGSQGGSTGGNRAMVEPLAKAAAAVGIAGLFLETHPDPEKSPSDGPNMIPLSQLESLLENVVRIRNASQA